MMTLTIIEMVEHFFLRLTHFIERTVLRRERFIDRRGDTMSKKERKPIELVRYDMLEPGQKYDTAGFVKIYEERIFDKEPDEIMGLIEDASAFRGRFEVLDIDGGIDDIPIWYQVRLIKTVHRGALLTMKDGQQDPRGWVNSLSIRKTKVRAAVHN